MVVYGWYEREDLYHTIERAAVADRPAGGNQALAFRLHREGVVRISAGTNARCGGCSGLGIDKRGCGSLELRSRGSLTTPGDWLPGGFDRVNVPVFKPALNIPERA